jgi:hypothetical protein
MIVDSMCRLPNVAERQPSVLHNTSSLFHSPTSYERWCISASTSSGSHRQDLWQSREPRSHLTSRQLNRICIRWMYANVTLKDSEQAMKCFKILISNVQCAQSVTELTLYVTVR